jgi:hypothetical protein
MLGPGAGLSTDSHLLDSGLKQRVITFTMAQ